MLLGVRNRLSQFALIFLGMVVGGSDAAERGLIIDYELYPADFSNAVIRRVAATGLVVDFRGSYPALTEDDLTRYRLIVVESAAGRIGSGIEPSPVEVAALTRYVAKGGLLVLAVPQDPEAFHQLGSYNAILDALGSGIRIMPAIADDESGRYPSAMFTQCYFWAAATFAAEGVDRDLVLDRSTILEAKPPALVLAKSSPTAFARVGLGRDPKKDVATPAGGFPLIAMAKCGAGYVLTVPRFTLNIGGFNGRVGTQPLVSLEWLPSSDRFIQNILSEMVGLSRGESDWPAPSSKPATVGPAPGPALPSTTPRGLEIKTIPPGGTSERTHEDPRAYRSSYRSTIRRDLFAPFLDHGIRAAWGDVDRDDAWLKRMADGFKSSGFNSIWGVGWPERFVSKEYGRDQRDKLRHAWETFASELDGSAVGWTVGVNFPGVGFDRARYQRCRGVDGREVEIISPLDLRYWHEYMIPALVEVARFGLTHPSVQGATIDFEMYGYDPFKIYPQAIGFEDVAYLAFLRAAAGHLDDATLAEAATLIPAQRYAWLRDRGLLRFFFLLLEIESEKLGRIIRQKVHAIDPDFIFGAYQAALPDTWFYRGLIRGLSTPEMPMVWMSFQVLSAGDVDRYWSNGCHILNATALMLGTFPIRDYPDAMIAGRKFHDGYWINRYNWLLDDPAGRTSIEIPAGSREDAWKSLADGNKRIDEFDRELGRLIGGRNR